jgi:hypothetical protein
MSIAFEEMKRCFMIVAGATPIQGPFGGKALHKFLNRHVYLSLLVCICTHHMSKYTSIRWVQKNIYNISRAPLVSYTTDLSSSLGLVLRYLEETVAFLRS